MLGQVFEHTCHRKDSHVFRAEAILQKDCSEANPFTRFVRGRVEIVDGQLQGYNHQFGLDTSSAISSLAEANAFLIFVFFFYFLPGGTRGFKSWNYCFGNVIRINQRSEWPWKESTSFIQIIRKK